MRESYSGRLLISRNIGGNCDFSSVTSPNQNTAFKFIIIIDYFPFAVKTTYGRKAQVSELMILTPTPNDPSVQ